MSEASPWKTVAQHRQTWNQSDELINRARTVGSELDTLATALTRGQTPEASTIRRVEDALDRFGDADREALSFLLDGLDDDSEPIADDVAALDGETTVPPAAVSVIDGLEMYVEEGSWNAVRDPFSALLDETSDPDENTSLSVLVLAEVFDGIAEWAISHRNHHRDAIQTELDRVYRGFANPSTGNGAVDPLSTLEEQPIALFPIQLETRFRTAEDTTTHTDDENEATSTTDARTEDPDELCIRVYPDEIHKNTHEAELTQSERRYGKRFWARMWLASHYETPLDAPTPETVAPYLDSGLELSWAMTFVDAGLDPTTWIRYAEHDRSPEEAYEYNLAGLDPDRLDAFVDVGVSAERALDCHLTGHGPTVWNAIIESGMTVETALDTALPAGLEPEPIVAYSRLGVSAQRAVETYHPVGLDPSTLISYRQYGITRQTALACHVSGLDPEEAGAYVSQGLDPEQAIDNHLAGLDPDTYSRYPSHFEADRIYELHLAGIHPAAVRHPSGPRRPGPTPSHGYYLVGLDPALADGADGTPLLDVVRRAKIDGLDPIEAIRSGRLQLDPAETYQVTELDMDAETMAAYVERDVLPGIAYHFDRIGLTPERLDGYRDLGVEDVGVAYGCFDRGLDLDGFADYLDLADDGAFRAVVPEPHPTRQRIDPIVIVGCYDHDLDPETLSAYREHGASIRRAYGMHLTGLTPERLGDYVEGDAETAVALGCHLIDLDSTTLEAFLDLGLAVSTIRGFHRKEIDPETIDPYLDRGLDPVAVYGFIDVGLTWEALERYLDVGFEPETAYGHARNGLDVNDSRLDPDGAYLAGIDVESAAVQGIDPEGKYFDEQPTLVSDPELREVIADLGLGRFSTAPTTRFEQIRARAWDRLVNQLGEKRAGYVIHALGPENNAADGPDRLTDRLLTPPTPDDEAPEPLVFPDQPRRPSSWSKQSRVDLLPDRWAVVLEWTPDRTDDPNRQVVYGAPIPDPLPLGPSIESPEEATTDSEGDLDEWVFDYETAVDAGMGVTIDLATLDGWTPADGFSRVFVVGVKASMDPDETTANLEALLSAHQATDGMSILPQGTQTNVDSPDPTGALDEEPTPVLPPRLTGEGDRSFGELLDGDLLAKSLGLDTSDSHPFAYVSGADGTDQLDARHANSAFWPATLGYSMMHLLLPERLAGVPSTEHTFENTPLEWDFADLGLHEELGDYLVTHDAYREHFIRYVRARGPLPPIRVGDQPYGILPVKATKDTETAVTVMDPILEDLVLEEILTIPDVIAGGVTIPSVIESDIPTVDLLDGGIDPHVLYEHGVGVGELLGGGVEATILRDLGETADTLAEAGVGLPTLLDAGFDLEELETTGATVEDVLEAATSADQLADVGLTVADLVGIDVDDLASVGFDAADLVTGGFGADDLLEIGFSVEDVLRSDVPPSALEALDIDRETLETLDKPAGVLKRAGVPASELLAAGYSLKELYNGGYEDHEIGDTSVTFGDIEDAGRDAASLIEEGLTADALMDEGVTPEELRTQGFPPETVYEVGFDTETILEAGYTAGELVDGGIPADDLVAADVSAGTLLAAGVGVDEVLAAGGSLEEVLTVGASVDEVLNAGVEVEDLLETGRVDVDDVLEAGVDVGNVLDAGVEIDEVLDAGVDVGNVLDAGVEIDEVLDAGVDVDEIIVADVAVPTLIDAGVDLTTLLEHDVDIDTLADAGVSASEFADHDVAVDADTLLDAGYSTRDLERSGIDMSGQSGRGAIDVETGPSTGTGGRVPTDAQTRSATAVEDEIYEFGLDPAASKSTQKATTEMTGTIDTAGTTESVTGDTIHSMTAETTDVERPTDAAASTANTDDADTSSVGDRDESLNLLSFDESATIDSGTAAGSTASMDLSETEILQSGTQGNYSAYRTQTVLNELYETIDITEDIVFREIETLADTIAGDVEAIVTGLRPFWEAAANELPYSHLAETYGEYSVLDALNHEAIARRGRVDSILGPGGEFQYGGYPELTAEHRRSDVTELYDTLGLSEQDPRLAYTTEYETDTVFDGMTADTAFDGVAFHDEGIADFIDYLLSVSLDPNESLVDLQALASNDRPSGEPPIDPEALDSFAIELTDAARRWESFDALLEYEAETESDGPLELTSAWEHIDPSLQPELVVALLEAYDESTGSETPLELVSALIDESGLTLADSTYRRQLETAARNLSRYGDTMLPKTMPRVLLLQALLCEYIGGRLRIGTKYGDPLSRGPDFNHYTRELGGTGGAGHGNQGTPQIAHVPWHDEWQSPLPAEFNDEVIDLSPWEEHNTYDVALGLATLDTPLTTGIDPRMLEFADSLRHLTSCDPDEIATLTQESLDLASYRLDAWWTSLATRRLFELRDRQYEQTTQPGLYVGGYGYVENLAPSLDRDPEYIHAPSLQQADTAAFLRGGYLAGTDDTEGVADVGEPVEGTAAEEDANPLAIDLSGDRVRDAKWLLDAVSRGQSLSELLGYEFERRMHEKTLQSVTDEDGVNLLAYRRALREVFPGVTGSLEYVTTFSDDEYDAEVGSELAQSDVLDGYLLVKQWVDPEDPDGESAWADHFGTLESEEEYPVPSFGGDAHDELTTIVDELREDLAAVSDLLVAEGVHQLGKRNVDKASAAIDALANGTRFDEPAVTAARPDETGVAHRLFVLLEPQRIGDEPRRTVSLSPSFAGVDQVGATNEAEGDDTGDEPGDDESGSYESGNDGTGDEPGDDSGSDGTNDQQPADDGENHTQSPAESHLPTSFPSLRATAEPALDAWASSVLPGPDRIGFVARYEYPGGTTTVPLTLDDIETLGVAPIDLIALAGEGDGGGQSAIDRWLAYALRRQPPESVPAAFNGEDGALEVAVTDPGDGDVSLAAVLETARSLGKLVDESRPADGTDLGHPSTVTHSGYTKTTDDTVAVAGGHESDGLDPAVADTVGELHRRGDRIEDYLEQVSATLDRWFADRDENDPLTDRVSVLDEAVSATADDGLLYGIADALDMLESADLHAEFDALADALPAGPTDPAKARERIVVTADSDQSIEGTVGLVESTPDVTDHDGTAIAGDGPTERTDLTLDPPETVDVTLWGSTGTETFERTVADVAVDDDGVFEMMVDLTNVPPGTRFSIAATDGDDIVFADTGRVCGSDNESEEFDPESVIESAPGVRGLCWLAAVQTELMDDDEPALSDLSQAIDAIDSAAVRTALGPYLDGDGSVSIVDVTGTVLTADDEAVLETLIDLLVADVDDVSAAIEPLVTPLRALGLDRVTDIVDVDDGPSSATIRFDSNAMLGTRSIGTEPESDEPIVAPLDREQVAHRIRHVAADTHQFDDGVGVETRLGLDSAVAAAIDEAEDSAGAALAIDAIARAPAWLVAAVANDIGSRDGDEDSTDGDEDSTDGDEDSTDGDGDSSLEPLVTISKWATAGSTLDDEDLETVGQAFDTLASNSAFEDALALIYGDETGTVAFEAIDGLPDPTTVAEPAGTGELLPDRLDSAVDAPPAIESDLNASSLDVYVTVMAGLVGTAADGNLGRTFRQARLERLREPLLAASVGGIDEAVPQVPVGVTEADEQTLVRQAKRVRDRLEDRLTAAKPHAPDGRLRYDTIDRQVESARARLDALIAESVPILPPFTPPNAGALEATFERYNDLSTGPSIGATMPGETWLQRVSQVRSRPQRLREALSYAESVTGSFHRELLVGQLPVDGGTETEGGDGTDDWIGTDGVEPDRGQLSVIAQFGPTSEIESESEYDNESESESEYDNESDETTGLHPTSGLEWMTGLAVDAWVESVPDDERTTGLAIQYDDPGNEPPQSILLATPRDEEGWSLDSLVGAVSETMCYARYRSVDLADLDAVDGTVEVDPPVTGSEATDDGPTSLDHDVLGGLVPGLYFPQYTGEEEWPEETNLAVDLEQLSHYGRVKRNFSVEYSTGGDGE